MFDFEKFGSSSVDSTQKKKETSTSFNFDSFGSDKTQQKEAPVQEDGVAKKIFDTLTYSEQGLGESVGQAINTQLYQKEAEANNARYMKAGNDMLAMAKKTMDPVKKETYMNLSQDYFSKAGKGIQDIIGGEIKTTGQVVGEAAGTILDVATAGTYGTAAKAAKTGELISKPLVSSVIPTAVSKLSSAGVKETAKKIGIGAGVGYGYDISQNLQNHAEGVDIITPGFGMLIGAGLPAFGFAYGATKEAIKGAPLDTIVKKGMEKGVKPSVAGKQTLSKIDEYHQKAADAVKSIINNKEGLSFTDANGEVLTGKLPETLEQFSSAVEQTKKVVFGEYDALTKKAGKEGAVVKFDSLLPELEKASKDTVLNLKDPQAAAYAADMAERFRKLGSLTTEQAQQYITQMNADLQSFYRNPSYGSSTKVGIDAMIANQMRQALDNVIETATGKEYQKLKNMYGALKTIEKDVAHRAIVDGRKNSAGLIDYSNIFTYGDIASGILTANPGQVGKGILGKGLQMFYKWRNDPNTIIKEMFSKGEKAVSNGKLKSGVKTIVNNKSFINKMFPQEGKESPSSVGKTILDYIKNKGGMSIEDVSKKKDSIMAPKQVFTPGPLTTKLLKKLEGRSEVSKQFISDLTNAPDLKQTEKDVIRQVLQSEGEKVNVADFGKKVENELLPLKIKSTKTIPDKLPGETEDAFKSRMMKEKAPRYESISLPDNLRGEVKNYAEHIYESPVNTSAGSTHFGGDTNNYFGHTRVEDMAPEWKVGNTTYKNKSEAKIFGDNPIEQPKTRRVIEVQSDLYQKGRLEGEAKRSLTTVDRAEESKYISASENKELQKLYDDNRSGNLTPEQKARWKEIDSIIQKNFGISESKRIEKLQQYNNPTAHFRMVREEIKRAADDGVEKLQFPTGETGMKIEGLSEEEAWKIFSGQRLNANELQLGIEIKNAADDSWIVTDVIGDGKFKAVQKNILEMEGDYKNFTKGQWEAMNKSSAAESFDISGKVDQNNPIYKFYEKELGRYLKNNFDAKLVTDKQGVNWMEVTIKPEHKGPVAAFGKAKIGTILAGATGVGALTAGVAGVNTLQKNSLDGKTFENKKPGTTILDSRSKAPASSESEDGVKEETKKMFASMETSGDIKGDWLQLEKETFLDLKIPGIKFEDINKNKKLYDYVAKKYINKLENTFGIKSDYDKALWSWRPAYFKKYNGNINNVPRDEYVYIDGQKLSKYDFMERRKKLLDEHTKN